MLLQWWRRRRRGRELSAYLDGELDPPQADRLAEELAFDAGARRELSRMRAVDALVDRVLAPPGDAVADLVAAGGQPEPLPAPARRGPSRWRPALLASLGLLLTAGVAVGLRRRGLV